MSGTSPVFRREFKAFLDDRAACRGMSSRIFFPSTDNTNYEEARTICERCPVIDECLDHHQEYRDDYGFAGGMTPDERRRMRGISPRMR